MERGEAAREASRDGEAGGDWRQRHLVFPAPPHTTRPRQSSARPSPVPAPPPTACPRAAAHRSPRAVAIARPRAAAHHLSRAPAHRLSVLTIRLSPRPLTTAAHRLFPRRPSAPTIRPPRHASPSELRLPPALGDEGGGGGRIWGTGSPPPPPPATRARSAHLRHWPPECAGGGPQIRVIQLF